MLVKATAATCALLVFGAGLAVVNEISSQRAENTRADLIAACERGNVQRGILYRNTLRDARTRRAAQDSFEGHAAEVIRHQAEGGFDDAEALVLASADVAAEPGSVVQDCEAAYE